MKTRFDGYLPVVVDLETSGINPLKNGILEIAAVLTMINENGSFKTGQTFSCHVEIFKGAHIDPMALEINKIDPYHPFRLAIREADALKQLFDFVSVALNKYGCRRAVLVGHNAHFDLSFLQAAMKRCKITTSPFHTFTCFDTATLSGLLLGKTVLSKALKRASIPFDKKQVHSAIYDAKITAILFCHIVNQVQVVE